MVTDHPDVGGGALELELDAHLRLHLHRSGATGGGPRMVLLRVVSERDRAGRATAAGPVVDRAAIRVDAAQI